VLIPGAIGRTSPRNSWASVFVPGAVSYGTSGTRVRGRFFFAGLDHRPGGPHSAWPIVTGFISNQASAARAIGLCATAGSTTRATKKSTKKYMQKNTADSYKLWERPAGERDGAGFERPGGTQKRGVRGAGEGAIASSTDGTSSAYFQIESAHLWRNLSTRAGHSWLYRTGPSPARTQIRSEPPAEWRVA